MTLQKQISNFIKLIAPNGIEWQYHQKLLLLQQRVRKQDEMLEVAKEALRFYADPNNYQPWYYGTHSAKDSLSSIEEMEKSCK